MSAFPLPPVAFTGASRRVEADSPFDWLRQGWATFRAAPIPWLGMGSAFLLGLLLWLFVVVRWGLLPGGALLAVFLTPLAAAMLYACAHLPHPALHLFFMRPRRMLPVLLLGGIVFSVFLVLRGLLLGAGVSGAFPAMIFVPGNPTPLILILLSPLFFLLVFWIFQAIIVIGLFALLLVTLHAMPVSAAIVASVAAYQKNLLRFTLFSPMLAGLLFLGLCTLGLGLPVLLPILFATLYAAYRDIFIGI
jgi:uncharacterized membrane protein